MVLCVFDRTLKQFSRCNACVCTLLLTARNASDMRTGPAVVAVDPHDRQTKFVAELMKAAAAAFVLSGVNKGQLSRAPAEGEEAVLGVVHRRVSGMVRLHQAVRPTVQVDAVDAYPVQGLTVDRG